MSNWGSGIPGGINILLSTLWVSGLAQGLAHRELLSTDGVSEGTPARGTTLPQLHECMGAGWLSPALRNPNIETKTQKPPSDLAHTSVVNYLYFNSDGA